MSLPNEMLELIFKNLHGKDLSRCRRVSRQWRVVADSFGEEYWRATSSKDFPDAYQEAQRKSGLSWRELYKSLSLWPKILSAKLETYHNEDIERFLAQEHDKKFIVVHNNVISYAHLAEIGISFDNDGFSDQIVYYDGASLGRQYSRDEENDGESYEFSFDEYDENERMIVLQGLNSSLYVIPKANMKIFDVGEYLDYENNEDHYYVKQKFRIVNDKVYFRNPDAALCVSTLVEENGVTVVKTEPLAVFNYSIMDMIEFNDDQVNILTTCGEVYSLINKNIAFVRCLYPVNRGIDRLLQSHGFEWSFKPIFKWLTSGRQETRNARITRLKNATAFRQGKTIILGTLRRLIHIYNNPFDEAGNLMLYSAKPTRTINLNLWYPSHPLQSQGIRQIDVIEIANGHRIIILCNVVHRKLRSMYNSMTMLIGLELKHCPGSKRDAEGDEYVVKRNRCSGTDFGDDRNISMQLYHDDSVM